MATIEKGKDKKGIAVAFRFHPSTLARLKEKAAQRCTTQTALLTSLVERLGGDDHTLQTDLPIAKAAAVACMAALDLIKSTTAEPGQLAAAASKLENFIELLSAGDGS